MVSITYEVIIEGDDFSNEEFNSRLFELGELIIDEVKKFVKKYDLIQTTNYLQGFFVTVKNNRLTINNRMKYANFLEYGTYSYFEQYGVDDFSSNPLPKKKDLTKKQASLLPKGGNTFAPIRRVLYNPSVMLPLLQEAFS